MLSPVETFSKGSTSKCFIGCQLGVKHNISQCLPQKNITIDSRLVTVIIILITLQCKQDRTKRNQTHARNPHSAKSSCLVLILWFALLVTFFCTCYSVKLPFFSTILGQSEGEIKLGECSCINSDNFGEFYFYHQISSQKTKQSVCVVAFIFCLF